MFKVDENTVLSDGVVDLKVVFLYDGNGRMGSVPMYGCFLFLAGTDERVGEITLRLGTAQVDEIYYNGNIGYGVDEQYRGNGFAGRACNLVKKIACIEGMDELTITCNIESRSSIRVLEKLGAEQVERVDVPSEFVDEHDRVPKRVRYRWKI